MHAYVLLLVPILLTFSEVAFAQKSLAEIERRFADPQYINVFEGDVVARDLPDGRSRELLNDFKYTDVFGDQWIAKKGLIWDGASIPKVVWSTGLSPFVGQYRDAAVIHDQYCDSKKKSDKDTHLVFYEIMRAKGTPPVQARLMYFAVDLFGPRWELTTESRVIERRIPIWERVLKRNNPPLQFREITTKETNCAANYNEELQEILRRSLSGEIDEETSIQMMRSLAKQTAPECKEHVSVSRQIVH